VSSSLLWLSCGSSLPEWHQTSGIKYRAFLTNNVAAGTAAWHFIVNAKPMCVTLQPDFAGNTPGMMVVSPNRAQTVVFSGNGTQFSDNQLSLINNASESNAPRQFAGMTESFVISPTVRRLCRRPHRGSRQSPDTRSHSMSSAQ